MFSPDAFSGYGFGSGAPSADGGPSISDAEAAANLALAQAWGGATVQTPIPNTTMNTTDPVVAARLGGAAARAQALEDYQQAQEDAMAQALAGAPTTGILAAEQQGEANAMAQQQEAVNLANAQEFDSIRDAEAGRLHADSLTGVPFAGGITVMRNAAGRPMGPQTIAANLPLGAGTLAQQIMTQNTLVQPDDGFGFNGPLSTGSLDSQPSFDNPDMDMISVPSQEEMAAAQVAQAPTPGAAGAPQAFGSPGSYDERRAQFGFGDINTDPVREHNARLMRAALGG